MPFEIVRNDITRMQVDAIVNAANPQPCFGAGVDSAIHKKAGPQLLEARKEIGYSARLRRHYTGFQSDCAVCDSRSFPHVGRRQAA